MKEVRRERENKVDKSVGMVNSTQLNDKILNFMIYSFQCMNEKALCHRVSHGSNQKIAARN